MLESVTVQNIECGGCAKRIETALEKRFGQKPVVDIAAGKVTIDLADGTAEELRDVLSDMGYPEAGTVAPAGH